AGEPFEEVAVRVGLPVVVRRARFVVRVRSCRRFGVGVRSALLGFFLGKNLGRTLGGARSGARATTAKIARYSGVGPLEIARYRVVGRALGGGIGGAVARGLGRALGGSLPGGVARGLRRALRLGFGGGVARALERALLVDAEEAVVGVG